uniref:Uncharacterized protein n=1 Tax=Tanacetum cinerariifolium TaxID=118510 RepID=A0A6L2P2E6_TANCI|nr:hypothetical protein [Tanacetum cinerariifolium]
METDEISERYIAPCFLNGVEAYDGEINLAFDENLISKEYAVKLCLDYMVKKRNKVVKKELIVALKGELYFVKFIINPKEDDVEPRVIFGRSLMRLVNGIVDFGSGVITVYPEEDLFKDDSEKTKKILETMAYHDKYKKVLDEIWKDKVELDGMIMKEEDEAIKKVKGEALKEKDDPRAFIFPIRLERKVNENALADTGSDINTMTYRIYEQLGREEIKKVDRGITMINHTQVEAMGILTNVLCQVGITTIIAKFLILDIPIDRDALIVAGRDSYIRLVAYDNDDEEEYEIKRNKFGAPIYGLKPTTYLNCNDPVDRSLALQAVINPFRKISVLKKAVSFLGLLHVSLQHINWKPDYKGCYTNEEEAKGQWRTEIRTMGGNDDEVGPSRSKCSRQYKTIEEVLLPQVHHEFLLRKGCNRDAKSRHQNGYANVAWLIARWIKRKGAGTQKESQICCGQFITKLARKSRVLSDEPGVPRVGIPRPLRASMQDLYERMGNMKIRQGATERMSYRQSYHWDSTHLSHRSINISSRMMMSGVEMTQIGRPDFYGDPNSFIKDDIWCDDAFIIVKGH